MDIPFTIEQTNKTTKEEYEAKIGAMAKAALADACTATNPREPQIAEIEAMYRKMWGE